MKEVVKYFDSLQMVVNILSFEGNTDIESVEGGLAKSFDLMGSLSKENLYSESINPKQVEALIKVSRIKSEKDGVISFLDVEQSNVEEWIERLVNAYPIYKEYHQVCENGGVLKAYSFEVPIIDGKISLTEAHIIPEFFIERKSELLSLFAEYGITLSESEKKVEGLKLPSVLDTDRARKYFARAIERGFIKPTSTGFEWIPITGRAGNAQLGYFLSKVYPPHRPIDTLERLFDVKKLSTYLGNAEYKPKRADVKRYRAEIDKIFID